MANTPGRCSAIRGRSSSTARFASSLPWSRAVRALDVQRLDDFAGHLSVSEMRDLDDALSLVLALR